MNKTQIKKKRRNFEKISCYRIFGFELFVNPDWKPLTKDLKIDGSFKVLHGEFFFRNSLEYCQILISEIFFNELIAEFDLILRVVNNQFVWTKNSEEIQKKLYNLVLDAEFLYLFSEKEDLKPEDVDDDEDIELLFILKE